MSNHSPLATFLLALIVLLLAIGLYFHIDSTSRLTQALAENRETLQKLNERLRAAPAAPLANPPVSSPRAPTAALTARFANSEFVPIDGRPGGQRVSAISAFSGNFNSLIRNEQSAAMVWDVCNDSLAARNLERVMEWEPVLAESWTVSPDGLEYVIKLRSNATWHPYTDPVTKQKVPAKPVTADDFVFFWECLQNPDIPCDSLRNYYAMLKDIKAIDEHTLRVTWAEPYSLSKVFTLGLSPLPRHYFRPDPQMSNKEFADYLKTTPRNMWVVGCGPYRFSEWKPNESLTFELYDDYYGKKPFIRKLIWKVIPEPNIQLVELEKGTLTELGLLPEQWLKETPDAPSAKNPEPRYRVVTPSIDSAAADAAAWEALKAAGKATGGHRWEKYQYEPPSTSWMYIGYNLKNPILADKRVRRALTMLVDRERILKEVYHGFGRLCDGPFVASSPYADPAMKPIPFDPEGAKRLLQEAGWNDADHDGILDREIEGKRRNFSFTLIYNNTNSLRRKIATIMQAELRKAGIDMQINPLDWGVVIQKVEEKSFDAVALGWTGVLENDPYQVWHSSQASLPGSSNHVSFVNEKADKLIEAGRREMDPEKRIAIYREFYRLVAEEQPYTFLLSNVSLVALKKEIRNARIYKLGMNENLQWLP